jgi:hypothetical protein
MSQLQFLLTRHKDDVLPSQAEAADASILVGPLQCLDVVVMPQQVGYVTCRGSTATCTLQS